MQQEKKKYEKPGIVFQDFMTGQITGTPEMVERIMRESEMLEKEHTHTACPLEDMMMPCFTRQGMKYEEVSL